MVEVSGLAVATTPKFILDRFGEEGLQKWKSALDDDVRIIFEESIVVNAWFDLKDSIIKPMQTVTMLFYDNEKDAALDLGRFSADFGLKGVLKVFVKMGSINYFVKRSASVIPNYYRPSAMEVIKNEKGYAEIKLTDFPNMHPIIEYRIAGWMERALEICGGQKPNVVTSKSLDENDEATIFEIRW